MKKILILILFILGSNVLAKEVPKNIYYINDGLYAYLENIDIKYDDNQKLYVEYRLKENDQITTLDLIEVKKNQNIIYLSDLTNNDIVIDSRFVLFETDYTYYDWSDEEKITTFEFLDKPTPKISNLEYKDKFIYKIDNEEEINNYFSVYKKIYNLEINYFEEYELDGKTVELPTDLTDIKLKFKIYYKIGTIKSNDSNTLEYENHPQTCMFDSTFCCNKISNISICIWILIIFSILILLFIIIDKKRCKKKEA